ncbi:MAG: hypothetical protein AB7V46_14310 [Thermomicrobiales bacterium]
MFYDILSHALRARRILSARRRMSLWREIRRKARESAGPPAVKLARARVEDRTDIRIDPLETDFRLDGANILVRAWLLLPADSVPEPAWPDLERGARNARLLDPMDARIFFLALSYGLRQYEIAALLGIHRLRVRRALLRSIMRVDRSAR